MFIRFSGLVAEYEGLEGTVPEWPGGELLPRCRWVSVPVVLWGAYSYASVRQRMQQVRPREIGVNVLLVLRPAGTNWGIEIVLRITAKSARGGQARYSQSCLNISKPQKAI